MIFLIGQELIIASIEFEMKVRKGNIYRCVT